MSQAGLRTWFDSIGGELLNGVAPAPMDPPELGTRIVATEPLGVGDTMLRIPLRWLLTADGGRDCSTIADAVASPAWPPALAALVGASRLDEDDAFALRLISELRAGEASPWAPYMALLPRSFNTPLFWPRDERNSAAFLGGTNAALLTDMLQKRITADWEGSLAPLIAAANAPAAPAQQPLAPHLAGATREDYEWALATIWSRALGLTLPSDGGDGGTRYIKTLFPVFDFLNHASSGSSRGATASPAGVRGLSAMLSVSDGALVVGAAHDAAAGDECFFAYGPYGDAKLLYSYGFTPAANPWRQLDLWVHPRPSDDAIDAKRAVLAGIEQTYDFRGTVRARPAEGAPGGFVVEISPELLATARVVVADGGAGETTDAALAALAAPGAPLLSARNEFAALGALVSTLRSRLARAEGRRTQCESAAAAARAAAEHEPGSAGGACREQRRAMAIRVRAEEETLMRDAIPVLEHAMVVLQVQPAQYAPPCPASAATPC
jgi:hypothetical protein